VSLSIRLLGRPALERDGVAVAAPKGQKAWALLAYLALTERPPSRRELASLLFADADDPLGALRWSLSQLRRSIDPEAKVGGDPVALELGEEAWLDVAAVLDSAALDPARADELGGELLEGITIVGAPGLESWLLVERRRLAGAMESLLHESALARLAADDYEAAVDLARRATALNPLEENNQEMLVRCLAASGDRGAARAQAQACEALFRRELGYGPSPAVRRAADVPEPGRRAAAGSRTAALGLLEAGQAAISAGATDAGITTLRQACGEAARCRDPSLRARALCALGMALVHSVRGWDEEGAASLHQALALAEGADAREVAATAHRELGYVGVLAGRGEQAVSHLARAAELAEGDAEIASVLGIRGFHCSDTANYPQALALLEESVQRADRAGDHRQRAFSCGMLARSRLLRGELSAAADLAEQSIADADREGWLAYRPFPETIRAEVDLQRGEVAKAGERFERAFTLGCQVEDPCWEGFAARGLGLVTALRSDVDGAARWLDEARTRCTRWPDRYEWAHAYVLEAAVGLAVDREAPRAAEMARQLEEVSSRSALRELTVRALLHRGSLGDREAADAARLVAGQIDNPALRPLLGDPFRLRSGAASAPA
jgi:DNA-binding SARP family transcriptional activator